MRFCCLLLVCLMRLTGSLAQSYALKGSAAVNGEGCYQLTPEAANRIGAVWHNTPINLTESFDIEFVMNFGRLDETGADGIMFVLQTLGTNALGNSGSEMGFASFPTSLGIEFDTFQNEAFYGDPAYDHIAVVSNGSVDHRQRSSLTQPVQALPNSPNIEDGKDHVVRINWQPSQQLLEVYFDCQKRVSLKKDIITDVFGGQTSVWWGFSGATGTYMNAQTVCLLEQVVVRNNVALCPGESATLVSRIASDDTYRWTPTDGLDNPSSRTPTATPRQTTTYSVTYKNYCGLTTTDSVRVFVPSTCTAIQLYVPDAFSPNRDGLNDLFTPVLSDSTLEQYVFTVYSRWGNVLFSTRNLNQGWDGTSQGAPCSEGAYAYRVIWSYSTQFGRVNNEKKGTLMLAR